MLGISHTVVHVDSHRVNVTFSPCHDQTRVQGVPLSIFLPLSSLVHMCPHTEDILVANGNSCLYANRIVFNGPWSRRQTLDLSTNSIPGWRKERMLPYWEWSCGHTGLWIKLFLGPDEWIEKCSCSPFFAASVLPIQVLATVSVHVPCFVHLPEANFRGSTAICHQKIDNAKKIVSTGVLWLIIQDTQWAVWPPDGGQMAALTALCGLCRTTKTLQGKVS